MKGHNSPIGILAMIGIVLIILILIAGILFELGRI